MRPGWRITIQTLTESSVLPIDIQGDIMPETKIRAGLRHAMLRVSEKEVHNPDFATLFFDGAISFRPGQFVMVWIPGVDENPIPFPIIIRTGSASPWRPREFFQKKRSAWNQGILWGSGGHSATGLSWSHPLMRLWWQGAAAWRRWPAWWSSLIRGSA